MLMSHVTISVGLMSHVSKALNAPCRPVKFRGLGPLKGLGENAMSMRYIGIMKGIILQDKD